LPFAGLGSWRAQVWKFGSAAPGALPIDPPDIRHPSRSEWFALLTFPNQFRTTIIQQPVREVNSSFPTQLIHAPAVCAVFAKMRCTWVLAVASLMPSMSAAFLVVRPEAFRRLLEELLGENADFRLESTLDLALGQICRLARPRETSRIGKAFAAGNHRKSSPTRGRFVRQRSAAPCAAIM
jgi:FAD/FMN-containing dehydrogenase